MRILAFDPGLERMGYGCVDMQGSKLIAVEHGLLETPRVELGARLLLLHEAAGCLLDRLKPDAVALERLFFTKNQTTAMDVAKAVGVVLLAAGQRGLRTSEYSPPEVKLAVVGHGGAEKRQVQFMVTRLLGLEKTPKPDDVADALAVAICHALRGK